MLASIRPFRYLIILLALAGLYSCSTTKYVPEGKYLLDKVKIKSDVPDNNSADLKPYIRQLPNFKMLGLNKTRLQIYSLSGSDSTKWINRFLKNMGEAPVIFDPQLVEKSDVELQKLLINKGYLDVEVSSDINLHDKKVDVTYTVTGNEPYRIKNLAIEAKEPHIKEEVFGDDGHPSEVIRWEPSRLRTSYIKDDMLFDRSVLDNERDRIVALMRNRGYFRFEKNSIRYEADTTSLDHGVDLKMLLNNARITTPDGEEIETPHHRYYIDNVAVYLDYDPLKYATVNDYPKGDSVLYKGYTFYYPGNSPSLKPSLLVDNCFMIPGYRYSAIGEGMTYSSFASLSALSNVHIQYEERIEGDSARLDCAILAIPGKKQSISFSVEGTNTSGDLGVAVATNYTHRNLFRGAETIHLRVRGAYEALSNSNSKLANPYWELGAEASITFPKFILPFVGQDFRRRMRTSTEFSLIYNYQTRPEYDRTLLSGGLSYLWHARNRTNRHHKFDLVDVNYVYLPRIDSVFLDNLPPSAELFGYKNQFIVGMSYSYYNSTFDPLQKQKSASSLRFSVESAGNLLYGISEILNRNKDEFGSYKLFNTYFAQFVKADFDYARTVVIDRQNTLAFRIGGGIGFPYGNSEYLPFEKRYYSGGANSVRAWSVRELGPGKYVPNAATTFFNQSGDVKLDLNIEYRAKLFWKFEGAAFIDAGNIWTIKDYEGQEGGQFKLDSFYKQIALGYGLGIRLDFNYFLVRFDWGWKAYNPAKRGKDAWTILRPNFGENFAWHIAVGYPF